jgi:peptidoglycan/LPS O-acetylase OafA/YrhL
MIDSSGLVDVLFVPLVVTLATGVGSLPRLLSTRVMVYLGHISFSLYMVHELVHTAWNWATEQFEIVLTPGWPAKSTVVGVLAIAFIGAVLLYHLVEEPASPTCWWCSSGPATTRPSTQRSSPFWRGARSNSLGAPRRRHSSS